MSDEEVIVCRPTKWFLWRAMAMVVMFGVFSGLFFKDWKIGYPRKNEIYYSYKAFESAETLFREEGGPGGSAASWTSFASQQEMGFPKEPGALPAGVKADQKWPDMLTDYEGYKKALELEGEKAAPPLWTKYSGERGWPSAIPKKDYPAKKVKGQLYYGIGSGALAVVALFFLVRTSRRTMKVDQDSYYPPGGEAVRFNEIKRIDKRKWDSKGLAYLFVGEEGSLKKLKVDGMVYGQFKEADGAPAEKLFSRILDNFSGELVELEEDEESDDDGAGSSARSGGLEEAGEE